MDYQYRYSQWDYVYKGLKGNEEYRLTLDRETFTIDIEWEDPGRYVGPQRRTYKYNTCYEAKAEMVRLNNLHLSMGFRGLPSTSYGIMPSPFDADVIDMKIAEGVK